LSITTAGHLLIPPSPLFTLYSLNSEGIALDTLSEQIVGCPYCGESVVMLVDPEDVGHAYVEDCQVCCRPITVLVTEATGEGFRVELFDENSAF